MKYEAPTIEGQPYFVPIVVKNKSFLIGYLASMITFRSLLIDLAQKLNAPINLSTLETGLDSTRFNDILMNGKRVSECSDKEYSKYIQDVVEQKIDKLTDEHPDNSLYNNSLLKIDCACGLGLYVYNKVDEIPEESVYCSCCGRLLIDYTGNWDTDYEFDQITKGD